MAILVDDPFDVKPFADAEGKPWLSRMSKRWCHLVSDQSVDELLDFASRIGLKRQWLQDRDRMPHFDITENKRKQAVAAGAVEVDVKVLVKRCVRGSKSKLGRYKTNEQE